MADDLATPLSRALVYLVSPRGRDNLWARVINGCTKQFKEGTETLNVSLAPNGQYVLTVDTNFFDPLPPEMQTLVLIHEAGHIALRHIERLLRVLSQCTDKLVRLAVFAIFNTAADLADNDAIVRNEPDFPKMLEEGKFMGLLPEKLDLPKGKSFEEYTILLLKDLKKIVKQMQKLVDQMRAGQGMPGGQGNGSQKAPGGSAGESNSDTEDSNLTPGLAQAAHQHPELFDALLKAFHELSGGSHKEWNELINKMTPEEAASAANKMKRHAKTLVRSAHEQTSRSRGNVPANIEALIAGLLAPDTTPWNWLLEDTIAGAVASKLREEMVPNMSLLADDSLEPWPGYTLEPTFNITWITDTSGSVSDKEFARACRSMNGLLSTNKSIKLRHIQIDTAIQNEDETDNLVPPEPTAGKSRYGYGGTSYVSAFKRILSLDTANDWLNFSKRPDSNPTPDLIVVFSDGGVCIAGEVFPQYKPTVPIVWLLAPGCHAVPGMDNISPDRVIQMQEIQPEF